MRTYQVVNTLDATTSGVSVHADGYVLEYSKVSFLIGNVPLIVVGIGLVAISVAL